MASRRRQRIKVSVDRGVFMISVAAELADMHPQTLRMYEARGLIEPQRSPKGTRLYSQSDVQQLRRIQEMTAELGLNLAGVERVIELEERNERLRRRVLALEEELARQRLEREAEVELVRRSYRAELVPFATGRALMRITEARRIPFSPPPGGDRPRGGPPPPPEREV